MEYLSDDAVSQLTFPLRQLSYCILEPIQASPHLLCIKPEWNVMPATMDACEAML